MNKMNTDFYNDLPSCVERRKMIFEALDKSKIKYKKKQTSNGKIH